MTLLESIALASFIIVNLGSLIGTYVTLSTRIADNTKDILTMRKDFEEHKIGNDRIFTEIKELLKDDRERNHDGHEKILDMVNSLKDSLNGIKIEIIKTIKAQ